MSRTQVYQEIIAAGQDLNLRTADYMSGALTLSYAASIFHLLYSQMTKVTIDVKKNGVKLQNSIIVLVNITWWYNAQGCNNIIVVFMNETPLWCELFYSFILQNMISQFSFLQLLIFPPVSHFITAVGFISLCIKYAVKM